MIGTDQGLKGAQLACVRGERLVFEGLDFALAPGGALTLTGPNGSGKTSCLRLIAGLLRPAAGSLEWRGRPVADDPEAFHAALHYVGHLDAVKPLLTVAEDLGFWAGMGGAGPGGVRPALDSFGLGPLADVPARFLSAGQRRRLALARLLAAPVALWLLDEPTVSLDEESTAALTGAIAAHRAGGGLVIAATHAALALEGAQSLRFGAG